MTKAQVEEAYSIKTLIDESANHLNHALDMYRNGLNESALILATIGQGMASITVARSFNLAAEMSDDK